MVLFTVAASSFTWNCYYRHFMALGRRPLLTNNKLSSRPVRINPLFLNDREIDKVLLPLLCLLVLTGSNSRDDMSFLDADNKRVTFIIDSFN